MKKLQQYSLTIVLVVLIGLGVVYIAPLFMGPQFEVVNESPEVVFVTAYWREESKEIGNLNPSASYRFCVKDEASMKFTARYPDGRMIESEGIYFTGGMVIEAKVNKSSIEVRYDFEK